MHDARGTLSPAGEVVKARGATRGLAILAGNVSTRLEIPEPIARAEPALEIAHAGAVIRTVVALGRFVRSRIVFGARVSMTVGFATIGVAVLLATAVGVSSGYFGGAMLSGSGRTYMFRAPWMAIWPGVAISLAVFGFNMLGDALRDVLDPRLRGSGRP